MSDNEPNDPRPADSPAPQSSGPSGWPGATHFGQSVNEPAPPPPPPAPVEEVVAVPLTKAQARGPAIEVEAERVAKDPVGGEKQPGAAGGTFAGPIPEPPRSAVPPPPFTPPASAAGAAAAALPFTGKRTAAVLAHLAFLIPSTSLV
jgi:hypothetical protein